MIKNGHGQKTNVTSCLCLEAATRASAETGRPATARSKCRGPIVPGSQRPAKLSVSSIPGRPSMPGSWRSRLTFALDADVAGLFPVPRKRRNRRNNAHSIGVSCIARAATSRNRCNIAIAAMLRPENLCCGINFLSRNAIPLERSRCCGCCACCGFFGWRGEIAPPDVTQVLAGVAPRRAVSDPDDFRLDPVLPQPPGQLVVGDGLALEVAPGRVLDRAQVFQNRLGGELLLFVPKYRSQI